MVIKKIIAKLTHQDQGRSPVPAAILREVKVVGVVAVLLKVIVPKPVCDELTVFRFVSVYSSIIAMV